MNSGRTEANKRGLNKINFKIMNAKTKKILRWIAVLPGSIISAFLIAFLLRWLLYLIFAHNVTLLGFIDEIYLFVVPIAFVYTGYKIAPKYKFKTAIVLFICYLIRSIINVLVLSQKGFQNDLMMQFSYRTILALLGAVLVLYLIKKSR